jgi:hypothetical protein
MHDVLVWAAAVVSLGALLLHLVVGGRTFVRPFLASDVAPQLKWTAYFAWHAGTILFSIITAGFVARVVSEGFRDYAAIAAAGAIAVVVVGLMVCIRARISPVTLAPVPLFAVVSVVGVISVLS